MICRCHKDRFHSVDSNFRDYMIFALHYEVYGSLSVSSVIAVLYGPVPALFTAAT